MTTLFPDHNARRASPHTLFSSAAPIRVTTKLLSVLPGEVFTWKNVANICHSSCFEGHFRVCDYLSKS
ncbi:BBT_HP_G0133390.mRNA.1.CDS.1 [Saccharomyces cerevisiae]|nr:BBT_HP_G0133390.mRNA.1.CDS.1 [Saccharomyces cerevisiae]CAI6977057.1 BBT_HP_G0133390.mRNA.1.CDS.1 [Saccharomyces cerevisiae]